MAFDRSLRRAAYALLTAALLVPAWGGLARQVRAAAQSEIDALKEEQRESQVKQQELKNQLADVKEDQAAAQQSQQHQRKLPHTPLLVLRPVFVHSHDHKGCRIDRRQVNCQNFHKNTSFFRFVLFFENRRGYTKIL